MRLSTSWRTLVIVLGLAAAGCNEKGSSPTTPTANVGGTYSLTIAAGATCAKLPSAAQSRTYAATIEPRGTEYVVTLTNATFLADERIGERSVNVHCAGLSGLGCNQFSASREGDQLRFQLIPNYRRFDDEFQGFGGSIVELVPPDNHQLGIEGTGLGRLDGGTIHAAIEGRIWYCPRTFRSYSEECTACENATNIAMTFSRR
jgi:hypothetical protein